VAKIQPCRDQTEPSPDSKTGQVFRLMQVTYMFIISCSPAYWHQLVAGPCASWHGTTPAAHLTWVGAALANLTMTIVLVRRLGLTGVDLGTLLATAVVCLGFILPHAMRTLGVNITGLLKEICLPTLLRAVLMAVVLSALRHTVAPSYLLSDGCSRYQPVGVSDRIPQCGCQLSC
jgi:hypothetical protein